MRKWHIILCIPGVIRCHFARKIYHSVYLRQAVGLWGTRSLTSVYAVLARQL